MLDGVRLSLSAKFNSVDGPPGAMAKFTNHFYRLSGANYINDHLKEGFGFGVMLRLGHSAGKSLDQLDALQQTSLRRFGIGPDEWDVIRQAKQSDVDGTAVLAPADILDLPDEAFAGLATGRRTIDAARQNLHERYSAYIIDSAREALSEPDARTRHMITGGSLPAGTMWGESARSVMQFKAFGITNIVKNLYRELFRDGVNVPGVAVLVAGGALMGHISNTLGDLAMGKEPRPIENADDAWKSVVRALLRGGGFGLYGDFLFGETNKYGRDLLDTLAGPTISMASDISSILANIREWELDRVAAESLQVAKQLSPTNLAYTKLAMDYAVFWQLQEAINPGYMRRWERKIERDTGQEFWLSPSEAVR